MDAWLLVKNIESNGERNRGLYILKSRGMQHSNQIREFLITPEGVKLVDVYVGPEGVLTGSSRQAQEAKEAASTLLTQQSVERKRRELEHKRRALEAQIAALRTAFEIEEEEASLLRTEDQGREATLQQDRERMAISRKSNANSVKRNGNLKRESKK